MGVLAIAAFVGKDEEVASIFDKFLEIFDLSGREGILRRSDDE